MSAKNIFYVNSNIVKKVCKKIINKEDKKEYKIIFENRHRRINEKINSIEEIYNLKRKNKRDVLKNWLQIKSGDQIVSEIAGGEFHLYVPYTHFEEVRMLLSHRLCSGFSIVEEGLMSYLTPEQMEKMVPPEEESIGQKIKCLGRLGEYSFYRDGYEKMYATNERAFPGRMNKEVLDVDFGGGEGREEIGKGECILVLDSLTHYEKEKSCTYVLSMSAALDVLEENYEKIHYKLHPDSYGNWQEGVMKAALGRLECPVREIDRSASIEDVAIGSPADVVVDLSSVGLYCGMFSDGNVYSFHDILSAADSTDCDEKPASEVSNIADCVPGVFWEHVEPLKK
ncbi:polysialyltransferase family glycosyltransferase [Salinibacter sp.]|uniref:polysialyltransferase family glycosyltransferase n=1 Tax=Salinibacter sp. TaxID=2065818 RepID=UPI0021E8B62D|nr:polysialyltransferase family glycosyltransferase [Salinibacter sp.]